MHKRLQIYKFVCKQILLNSKAKNKIIIVEWYSKISIKLLNDYIPLKFFFFFWKLYWKVKLQAANHACRQLNSYLPSINVDSAAILEIRLNHGVHLVDEITSQLLIFSYPFSSNQNGTCIVLIKASYQSMPLVLIKD